MFLCIATKVQNNNSVKNEFIKDFDDKNNKKNIKFIKASIGEKEFYKKAIKHIAINEHAPADLLKNSKFGFVEYDYAFYAVLDVDFSLITVNNSTSFSDGNTTIKISSSSHVNSRHGKIFCIDLGKKDLDNSFMHEVLDIYENNLKSYLSADKNKQVVEYPTKQVVESKINECINDYKQQILAGEKERISNKCVYAINKINIIALPIYTLKFKYAGKEYKLSTSANRLNIIGDVPTGKTQTKELAEKKVLPFTTVSVCASLIAIIFAIINLQTGLSGHLVTTFILGVVAFLVYFASWVVFKKQYKKMCQKDYALKLENLKEFFKANSLTFTKKDQTYIKDYLRWF